jgi:hypothetical protein
MATNISVDNAVDFLALAEHHSIEPTKSLAVIFTQINFTDFVKTSSCASLIANNLPSDRKRMRDGGPQTEESARKRKNDVKFKLECCE